MTTTDQMKVKLATDFEVVCYLIRQMEAAMSAPSLEKCRGILIDAQSQTQAHYLVK